MRGRQTVEEIASPWGGALDTATVLRDFLKSAKGADVRHQTREGLASSSGGALDTVTVLRDFLKRSLASRAPPLCGLEWNWRSPRTHVDIGSIAQRGMGFCHMGGFGQIARFQKKECSNGPRISLSG
jgi:hypothetical protein